MLDVRGQLRLGRLDFRERMAAGLRFISRNYRDPDAPWERWVQPYDARRARISSPVFDWQFDALMFGSNNYLGLAHDPRVRGAAISAIERDGVSLTGSALMNGCSPEHRALERALAELKGYEDALIFSSGYLANMSWVRVLVRSTDAVVYDERSHASFLEGLAQSDARAKIPFAHNSLEDLKRALAKASTDANDVYVFTEGIFSMDGDVPPLAEIAALCRSVDAILIVDDAHGTGVLGERGKGVTELFDGCEGVDIVVGTMSKALGCVGGFLCASYEIVTFLRALSPANVFTASLPPPIVAGCLQAIEILSTEPERVARLQKNAKTAREMLGRKLRVISGSGPIIPVLPPPNVDAQRLCFELLKNGIFANCAVFPAVPVGGDRLRITVGSEHTLADIEYLADTLTELVETAGRTRSPATA